MEKVIRKLVHALLISLFLSVFPVDAYAQTAFTQNDRDLLIELKTKVTGLEKQITDLREDMNKRFEQMGNRISDLREDMNKRFEQFMTFVWILATIFAAITVATISFALWDRRTMIRPFETKVSQLDKRINENRESNNQLIAVLKEYAAKDKKFANLIQRFNLF